MSRLLLGPVQAPIRAALYEPGTVVRMPTRWRVHRYARVVGVGDDHLYVRRLRLWRLRLWLRRRV